MKVQFIMSLCGGEKDRHAKDIEDFTDEEAIALIDAGIATAVNKKDYKEAKERIFTKEQEKTEKELKLQAILYEDNLKAEKERLLTMVEEINVILGLTEPTKSDKSTQDLGGSINEELVILKAKADELEVAYDEDVTVEALTKLIKDTESKE